MMAIFDLPPRIKLDLHPGPEAAAPDASRPAKDAKANPASRKGQPWTEAEHLAFLAGLKKLGPGNWKGISRYFVSTRTPTQIASHAQKYALRQTGVTKRKSRFSLLEQAANSQGLHSVAANAPMRSWWLAAPPMAVSFGPSGIASPAVQGLGTDSRQRSPPVSSPRAAPALAATMDARAGSRIIRPTAHHAALRSSEEIAVLHDTLAGATPPADASVILQPSAHSAFTPTAAAMEVA